MRRILGVVVVGLLLWFVLRRQSVDSALGTPNVPSAASMPGVSAVAPPSDLQPKTRERSTTATSQTNHSSRGFQNRARLDEHYAKHGAEFPGLNENQYLAMAQALRDEPVGGDVLEIVRLGDGVVSRFDKRSGAFLAFDRDGTIRTFFKPNDGERYFKRQVNRPPSR